MDLDEIKREVNLIEYAKTHYGYKCDSKGRGSCLLHLPDKHSSFSIFKGNDGIWRFKCFHDDTTGTTVDLKAKLENKSVNESIKELLEEFSLGKSTMKKTAKKTEYIYKNLEGKEVYKKVKIKDEVGNKTFFFEHKTGDGWKPGRGNHEPIPYNLNESNKYTRAIICEGEKDADNVKKIVEELEINYWVTSAPNGMGSWPDSLNKHFKRIKETYMLYDVGKKAEKNAKNHAAKLEEAYPQMKIHVAKVPLEKEGADITDHLEQEPDPQMALLDILEHAEGLKKKEKAKDVSPLGKKFSARELLETELPPEQLWIGKGLLPEQGYMVVAGHAKQGKTILCLQMGLSLVSGHPFLDEFPIKKKARVLYLFAENTTYGLKEILKKQLEGAKRKGWFILPEDLERFQFEDSKGLMLNTKTGQEELLKLVEDNKADIVFVDPIGLFVSADILRLDVVTKLINNLNLIAARTGCTWILIHHYRKPQEKGEEESIHKILGSSAWGNYCESFLGLERAHKQRSMNFKRLDFVLRREEAPDAMTLIRNPETLLYTAMDASEYYNVSSVTAGNVVKILKRYKNGASYTEITSEAAARFGVTKTRIQELLNEARDSDLAYKEKGKFGKWFVSEKAV